MTSFKTLLDTWMHDHGDDALPATWSALLDADLDEDTRTAAETALSGTASSLTATLTQPCGNAALQDALAIVVTRAIQDRADEAAQWVLATALRARLALLQRRGMELGEAWEALLMSATTLRTTTPSNRTRVLARLSLDTLNHATKTRTPPRAPENLISSFEDYTAAAADETDPSLEATGILHQLVHARAITPDEARFLAPRYWSGTHSGKRLAQRAGLTHGAYRQRVSRLERRVARAAAVCAA